MLSVKCAICGTERKFKWKSEWERAKTRKSCGVCRYQEFGLLRKISPEKQSEIISLANNGQKTNQIAKSQCLSYNTVKNVLVKNGLFNYEREKKSVSLNVDGTATCSFCGLVVETNQLYQTVQGNLGSYCKKCRSLKEIQRLNKTFSNVAASLIKGIHSRCKISGRICTISRNDIIEIFDKQKGLCFYTGEGMSWQRGEGLKRNSVSVDRVDSSLGYIQGNIVLCLHAVNQMKSSATEEELERWIPQWHQKIRERKLHISPAMPQVQSEVVEKSFVIL